MNKETTCFFTGHRIISNDIKEILRNRLKDNIIKLIEEYDVDTFISGGALGFDTIAAEVVIEIRKKYPNIKLKMYLPCYGQSKKWSHKSQYKYRLIVANADECIYTLKRSYTSGCMKFRNIQMIWDSRYCIAFYKKERSGTSYTVKNAQKSSVKVINIADEI